MAYFSFEKYAIFVCLIIFILNFAPSYYKPLFSRNFTNKNLKTVMHQLTTLIIAAFFATNLASAQTSKFDIKYHRDTVLADGKALATVRGTISLPVSYTIQKLDGTELVAIKPVYVQVATGKREGYFLITFKETGNSIERNISPGFIRNFVQELIETETLTAIGIDIDQERRFVSKNQKQFSVDIKAKTKQ
jgi:hypothetical protein